MGWELTGESTNQARFVDERSGWRFECELDRPELGLQFLWSGKTLARSVISVTPPLEEAVSLDALDTHPQRLFPPMTETYFRGRDAIAVFPQANDSKFGISVTYRVVSVNEQWMAVETILALQTELLDSHPTADLIVRGQSEPFDSLDGGSESSWVAAALPAISSRSTPRPAAAILVNPAVAEGATLGNSVTTVVMLPPSDQAAAGLVSHDSSHMRIRLLAEFLEKGVIRKTRYWVTLWRHRPSYAELVDCYIQLQEEPLPLTP